MAVKRLAPRVAGMPIPESVDARIFAAGGSQHRPSAGSAGSSRRGEVRWSVNGDGSWQLGIEDRIGGRAWVLLRGPAGTSPDDYVGEWLKALKAWGRNFDQLGVAYV